MAYKFYTKLAHASNYGRSRSASTIKYIVMHYTANKTDTAYANANYFQSANRNASAHFFCDKTSVYQSVPDLRVAWSVGGSKYSDCAKTGGGKLYKICTNTNSISIELCSYNGAIASETVDNAVELVKSLMIKYNVPIDKVIRHFDVSGKKCIGWTGWLPTTNETLWNNFKARLGGSVTSTPTTTQPRTSTSSNSKYNKVFNATYYANKYADLKKAFRTDSSKLLNHYITNGVKEGRQAISTFNIVVYKSSNADLQKAFGNDMMAYVNHYIQYGYKENRKCI